MTLPHHIAIIMDGNGRWAESKKMPRIMGHRSGMASVDRITEECARLGIKALTLYAFSTENWKRPKPEVDALMEMLGEAMVKYGEKLIKNDIKFNTIGRRDRLPEKLTARIGELARKTASNNGMVLTLALDYGSREEIVNAARLMCEMNAGNAPEASYWNEENFKKHLYTHDLPDPDLVIRTSGEMRLSNFLMWQAAYAELYVTDILWPDFDADELNKALSAYAKRKRRFGG